MVTAQPSPASVSGDGEAHPEDAPQTIAAVPFSPRSTRYDTGRMRYGPADSSLVAPLLAGRARSCGCRTCRRTEDVDVAVVGIPTDDAVSFKSGARFGPEAIRSASALLRPYNPLLPWTWSSTCRWSITATRPPCPATTSETLERIEAFLEPVHEAGVTPLCLGGDHSMVLAELRAAAAVHGPLALVHLDAHTDVWEAYYGARYFHGTCSSARSRRGWSIRTPRCRPACGARCTARRTWRPRALLGYDASTGTSWRRYAAEYGDRVRARVGDRPAFLSFDIDFVDPAFAPATGTPEVGGPSAARRWPTCAR